MKTAKIAAAALCGSTALVPMASCREPTSPYGVAADVRWEPRLDGKLLAAEMSRRTP